MKNNHNTALKNPAIILGVIGIVMIILIIIFNIRSKFNSSKNQNQTNSIPATTAINIDKNSEYAKLIDKYFQALNEKDAEKLISLFPSNKNYTKESVEAQLNQMYSNYEAKSGSNIKITYEFISASEMNGETLETLKKQINNVYGIESGVTKVYSFEIYLIRTGDINTEQDTISLNLAKINDKWYIV